MATAQSQRRHGDFSGWKNLPDDKNLADVSLAMPRILVQAATSME